MPSGVQGNNPAPPTSNRPAFTGPTPSTSFSAAMAQAAATASSPFGSGSCTRMPSTSPSWFSASICASNSFCEVFAGSSRFREVKPARRQARCLPAT